MHRGAHHWHGNPYDPYDQRGYQKEDNMIEIVQQFREFKPYLKKRLAFIKQSGRALELQDEVENIEFYLEVMQDILADESHGVDQLRSFIDKIHEMIRKNPLTDFPANKRRSLEGHEEFNDNDRPRSPSPERRGSESSTNVPLIPTHGASAHRTVDVNFTSRNERDHPKGHKSDADEWGRPVFENSFTRREPYKDVDMRGGYYPNNSTGSMGRGQRRWSEEDNFNSGARGLGRGMGRGAPVPHHRKDDYRQDLDIRAGRGRGFSESNEYERRNDYYRPHDSKERDRDYKSPEWLTGGGSSGPSNGNNKFDEWQQSKGESSFRGDAQDRRHREEETWRNESREREEKYQHAQHIAKYFERRPSSESRRDERSDDYISMFDRRSRKEASSSRHEMGSSPHSDYRRGDFHGRGGRGDEDRQYPGGAPPQPLMNPMTSIPLPHQAPGMGYGVHAAQPHYNNPGLLGPVPTFANQNPGLLPMPVGNQAGLAMGMQNVAPPPGMGFQHHAPPGPPQTSTFPMADVHAASSGYRVPPVPLPRPPMPPSPIRTTAPLVHPPDHYPVPSGSPNYTSPTEPSAEQVREITMMKAKQCFGRVVSRTTTQPSSHSPSTASPGPNSPNNGNDNQTSCGLDPRLNRSRPSASSSSSGHHSVQNSNRRQISPPGHSPPNSRSNSAPNRPDAGNVLRMSASDPRAKSRIEQERKRLQDTRDRFRSSQESHKSYNSNNKKGSKMQELRKQLEKEGFHRLGRPAPRKQGGSFEDAITAEPPPDMSSPKSAESGTSSSSSKHKSPSSSSSYHAKEKETESSSSSRQSRSHTEKTDSREKSPPKKKGGEKAKGKNKKSGEQEDKRSDTEEGISTRTRSPRRLRGQNGKTSEGNNKSTNKEKDSQELQTVTKTIDITKPPAFKIPRKPKPKEPEVVVLDQPSTNREDHNSSIESSDKDVSTSPPVSPEPALSQVPDLESRNESIEDNERPRASSSAKSVSSRNNEESSNSDVNPNALEYLKQFLITSADPEEREFFLANPENLKHIFFKIKSELSAAKGKDAGSSGQGSSGTADKSQPANDEEEEVQERGRSREKKKNTKRRSSLEKLHDALKEMRFDTMLPLGPRRCTRSGQDEAAAAAEAENSAPATPVVDESSNAEPPEEMSELELPAPVAKAAPERKRGRPRKDSPKKKVSTPPVKPIEEISEFDETIDETEEPTSPDDQTMQSTPQKRGQKRKLKPTKVNPRKKVKKSGPMTRAQAALKNKSKEPAGKAQESEINKGVTTRNRNKQVKAQMLKRLSRRRMGALDTAVNQGLCKVKLESDYVPHVKCERKETDPFLGGGPIHDQHDHLADQLANIINENLEDNEIVANLENQTEDNMDFNLDVFNSLDAEDTEVHNVKHELDLTMEEAAAATELSFEGILGHGEPEPDHEAEPEPTTTLTTSETQTDEQCGDIDLVTAVNSEMRLSPEIYCSEDEDNYPPPPDDDRIPSPAPLSPPHSPDEPSDEEEEEDLGEELLDLPSPSCSSSYNRMEPPMKMVGFNGFTGFGPGGVINRVRTRRSTGQTKGRKPSIKSPRSSKKRSTGHSLSFGPNLSGYSGNGTHTDNLVIKTELLDRLDSTEPPDPTEPIRNDVIANKCEKCSFSGKKIVSHYVNKHYPCNIPQARLMPETFNGLIELNTSESPQLLEIVLDESQNPIWPCLYCDDRYDCIVEFYDHLASHTGEFRYECAECGISYPFHKSLINHVKIHKGLSKNCIRFAFESTIVKSTRELSGFLCNDCFYFQLRFESIIRHIEQTGHSSLDVRSVRLIRPSVDGSSGGGSSSSSLETKQELKDLVEKASESKFSPVKAAIEQETFDALHSKGPPSPEVDETVFFGSCEARFTPSPLPTGDFLEPDPQVFEDRFLNKLKTKVDLMKAIDRPGRRRRRGRGQKRKRRNDGFDMKKETPAVLGFINQKKRAPLKVKIRRTIPKPPTTLDWDESDSDDSLYEYPNDFVATSESDSDTSSISSSDSEAEAVINFHPDGTDTDDGYRDGMKLKPESLKSNEFLIRLRDMPIMEPHEIRYFEKHDLVAIKRSGDCFAPSTLLYGYVRPGISRQTPHKLRDQKELEKLCPTQGHRVHPVKCMQKYQEMIKPEKIVHLFKCMSTVCSYTTNRPAEFLQHLLHTHFTNSLLTNHGSCTRLMPVRDVVMLKDADCCCYCAVRYKEARDLVEHVMNQHAKSHYQCNRCFYRAYYSRYVARHFELEHPGETLDVIKIPRVVDGQVEESTLFQIFVYKCESGNPQCDQGKRFVFREDFMAHLRHCNPGGLNPCHLCRSSHTVEGLIEHYKTHNLFRFHCSYCPFGSEVKADLDDHFVFVHPNTSGRVFYRVKTIGSTRIPRPIYVQKKPRRPPTPPSDEERNSDNGGNGENSENEDSAGDKGRVINLKGRDLYRCITGDCDFTAENHDTFKDHLSKCEWVLESRSLNCAHCERKMKSATNLLEHMKVHGEKKQTCSLCPFRCYTNTEITKHIKGYHKVLTHRVLKKEVCNTDIDPDLIAFPKDVMTKSLCSSHTFQKNYYSFARRAVYSLDNINKLPQNKVFSSDLICALCPYSTKVRSNIIRHLYIHQQAVDDRSGSLVVPTTQIVNPVPYLSREGLEFDKMMNLAASSHKTSGVTATEGEVKKLPQFVKEQFRYVCSVCDHITSDDTLLQTHIRVIHSEVSFYKCPHCQKLPESRENPDNTVPLDKIAFHLRLHGPKLYKCGHCKVVHHQLRLMEKHIPEKHPEKKPIHYLIRDVDPDGVPSRPTTSGANRRSSLDDNKIIQAEKWKCYLCNSKAILNSWEEAKAHIEQVHKVDYQFLCLVCSFCTDEVQDMIKHCRERCKDWIMDEDKKRILVMFAKCDHEEVNNPPAWKRAAGPVRHIHGNFTEDSLTLIKQYSSANQQGIGDQQPTTSSSTFSPVRNSSNLITVTSKPLNPTTSKKARRSIAGCSPSKGNSMKGAGSSSPVKHELFKYYCSKCDVYKTKNPQELRIHLCNEYRYKRWMCLVCATKFTTEKSLRGHLERDHQKPFLKEHYLLLAQDMEIEGEIDECIEKQNRKKEMILSYAVERNGKLSCVTCQEDGYTYDTFETHILLRHSS